MGHAPSSARRAGPPGGSRIRIAIALAGLHRVTRGAEVAFESIARELARMEDLKVTLFGSGEARASEPYAFQHVGNVARERFERWPRGLLFRGEYAYEELTFVASLLARYRPGDFDVTVTCSYPFTNWLLARRASRGRKPAHIFVTENGDHPACSRHREFRFFSCDGLVCTNPEYYERNQERWPCTLIPNGVDTEFFSPGRVSRAGLDLPDNVPLAVMVSALIPSKRIDVGIRAAACIEKLHLLVCGDGPERHRLAALGAQLMPGRVHWRTFARAQMPDAYRAADLLLHLSLDEPFGNAYVEALSIGLPVVAHDRSATRWIVEDRAVLVDSRNPESLVEGIERGLARSDPVEVAARRQLVERRFTWPAVARAYRKFFEAAVARSSASPQGASFE